MSEPTKIEWLRKLDKKHVIGASETLLKRNDLFPCDINGNFTTTGTQQAAVAAVEKELANENVESPEEAAANQRKVALMSRAKDLGIVNPHAMKEETLLDKIAIAEAALEDADETE